jgi:hypothetical protein
MITKGYKRIRDKLSWSETCQIFHYFEKEIAEMTGLPNPKVENPTEKFHCDVQKSQLLVSSAEAKLFMYVLLLMKMLDAKELEKVIRNIIVRQKTFLNFCMKALKTSI